MAKQALSLRKASRARTKGDRRGKGRRHRASHLNKFRGELNEILFAYYLSGCYWPGIKDGETIRKRIGVIRKKIGNKQHNIQVSRAMVMADLAWNWLLKDGIGGLAFVAIAKTDRSEPWNPADVFGWHGKQKIGFSLKSGDRKRRDFRYIGLSRMRQTFGLEDRGSLNDLRNQLLKIYGYKDRKQLADHILDFWFGCRKDVDFVQIVGTGGADDASASFSRIHLAQDRLRRFGAYAVASGQNSIRILSEGVRVLTIRFKRDSGPRGSIKLHADV